MLGNTHVNFLAVTCRKSSVPLCDGEVAGASDRLAVLSIKAGSIVDVWLGPKVPKASRSTLVILCV